MIVVVVNHWGGVPAALRGNALALLDRESESSAEVPLTRLDPALGFRAAVCCEPRDEACFDALAPPTGPTLFHAFAEAGFRTVVLGATGLRAREPPPPERATGQAEDVRGDGEVGSATDRPRAGCGIGSPSVGQPAGG